MNVPSSWPIRLIPYCREVLHHALVHPNVNVREYLENDPEAYYSKAELLEPLTLIYNSLLACGDTYIAHGRLLDCIRQVRRFSTASLCALGSMQRVLPSPNETRSDQACRR